MDLLIVVYAVSHGLASADGRLALRLIKLAVAIPANIAEAHGGASIGAALRCLRIGRTALRELVALIGPGRPNTGPEPDAAMIIAGEMTYMMDSLIRSLERRRRRPLSWRAASLR
jgi:hypothetical protein